MLPGFLQQCFAVCLRHLLNILDIDSLSLTYGKNFFQFIASLLTLFRVFCHTQVFFFFQYCQIYPPFFLWLFSVHLRHSFLKQCLMMFYIIFKNDKMLLFIFSFLNNTEFILVCSMSRESHFIFPHIDSQLSQCLVLNSLDFSHWFIIPTLSNAKFAICIGLFFLFIWKGVIYILDTNPLPFIYTANVLSHFEIFIDRVFKF